MKMARSSGRRLMGEDIEGPRAEMRVVVVQTDRLEPILRLT